MSEWTFAELEKYDKKINEVARSYGLDWHPIIYEIGDYFEMIGHMSYHGLPSHYHHWSFGKQFELIHQHYNAGETGLPYEMIINANPSIAYLMRENPTFLQILVMAHCVAHSDFFKNNVLFKKTQPDAVVARSRSAKKRVQEYIEDPSIGIKRVEEILDAAHSVKYHVERFGRERVPHEQKKKELIQQLKSETEPMWADFLLDRVPLEPDYDILGFIAEHGNHLESWEKDLIEIVRQESIYFMPQIRTKILNEGHASFWHHKIMSEIGLPQEYHIPFLASHNQVVRPLPGQINPYHIGYYLFKRIEEEYGIEKCLFVREIHHDESALREFIDEKACRDLELFTYHLQTSRRGSYYEVDDVSDEIGWEKVKETLLENVGVNSIPRICVEEVKKGGSLILRHEHDGRDLKIDWVNEVIRHISTLWESDVKLYTIVDDDETVI